MQEKFLVSVMSEARNNNNLYDLTYKSYGGGGVLIGEYKGEEVLLAFEPKNINNLRMGYGKYSRVDLATDASRMGKLLAKWLNNF